MIKGGIVPTEKIGALFYCAFEMPESDTDVMLESRDNLEARKDAKVGLRCMSPGSLQAVWRM